MKVERIKAAMAEAQEFLERAEAMLAALPKGAETTKGHGMLSASLHRSSLELWHKLAAMRNRK